MDLGVVVNISAVLNLSSIKTNFKLVLWKIDIP